MAAALKIKRGWFHAGRFAHYDIPALRQEEIASKTEVVNARVILRIIKGETPP